MDDGWDPLEALTDLGRNWDFGSVDWAAPVPKTIIAAKHETTPSGEVYLTQDGGTTWNSLALELHLDLYRIDLGRIVSKYIGETEKNLRRLFAAAEASDALLFFDEADALFGKRSRPRSKDSAHHTNPLRPFPRHVTVGGTPRW